MTRDVYRPPEYCGDPVDRAIGRLKSFQNGDIAVQEVVSCGAPAIAPLRTLLFARDPSGLYQTRVRAIDALAKLGAEDTLVGFLAGPHDIGDPAAQLGEDAVINAAARAVAHIKTPMLFEVLKRLAARPCLVGVIFALGVSGREETIPFLVDALAEDESRTTAETALRRMGATAEHALIRAARRTDPGGGDESESRLRQRRSALRLLLQTDLAERAWDMLRSLVTDRDPHVALSVCELAFRRASPIERHDATLRLLKLFCHADWIIREDIKRSLCAHRAIVNEAIEGSAELRRLTQRRGPTADLLRWLRGQVPVDTKAHV